MAAHSTLAEAFQHWAAATPDSPAVVSDAGTLSYRQVRRAADVLAGRLGAAGLGRDDVVILLLPRSAELIVAAVAATQAGAAYACVDPRSLTERLGRVLERTRAGAVVTTHDHGSAAVELGARTIEVPSPGDDALSDINAVAASDEPDDRGRAAGPTPRDVAAVIFTSGSTGEPRAVMIEHRALVPVVQGASLGLGPGDTVLLHAAVAFDASVFEMWSALANGGTVAIAPPDTLAAADLQAVTERHHVTGVLITAALFRLFVEGGAAPPPHLRWILVGGEEAPAEQARRFAAAAPGCALYNCYGPTETTVFATWYRVPSGGDHDGRIPIGAPTLGKRVLVFDEELRPCPDGVTGEIYIAGAGLARGYRHAPAITADRFVPDPTGGPGERMYRTGDLGRRGADGVLEFAGRIDRQVKVSGYRVEPGEVERQLIAHRDIAQAVVVPARRPSGRQALCAYLVAAGRAGVAVAAVRDWLRDRLPPYLVPARFVVLPALPLTDNGKVDTTALPDAWERRPISDTVALPPRTDLEARLVDLWSDVLGVREIGIADNFFELGGDSLTAVEMLDLAGRSLGVELTARDLIGHQSIEEFAECVDWRSRAARAGDGGHGGVRVRPLAEGV